MAQAQIRVRRTDLRGNHIQNAMSALVVLGAEEVRAEKQEESDTGIGPWEVSGVLWGELVEVSHDEDDPLEKVVWPKKNKG